MREQETRGIKDPERFQREKRKKQELERRQEEAEKKYTGERGGQLKVFFGKNVYFNITLNGIICRGFFIKLTFCPSAFFLGVKCGQCVRLISLPLL